jgi:hypothetical protein
LSDPDAPGPEPLWAAVVAGLRQGPGPGAAALWAALSPRARAPLGDEAGARRTLERGLLAPLVRHARAETAPWERRGDAARTRVEVDGAPAGPAQFTVSARLGADGAWRLTGLRREDLPLE